MESDTSPLTVLVDACAVASSSILFTIALLDTSFETHSSPSQNTFLAHLEFKQSPALRTAMLSLVVPLLLMRLVQLLRDLTTLPQLEWSRRLLFIADASLFLGTLSGFNSVRVLEGSVFSSLGLEATPWSQADISHLRDTLKVQYLASLGLSGLMVIMALVKLSLRAEMLGGVQPLGTPSAEWNTPPVAPASPSPPSTPTPRPRAAPPPAVVPVVPVEAAVAPPQAPPLVSRGWQALPAPPVVPGARQEEWPRPVSVHVQVLVGLMTYVSVFAALKRWGG